MWKPWTYVETAKIARCMSVMDGYEAAKQIRSMENGEDTMIVALSASSFEEEQEIAFENGCNAFLQKLFREIEIFELMHTLLGIQFVYDEYEGQQGTEQTENVENKLTLDTLTTLPLEVLKNLKYAVMTTDTMKLEECIDEIRSYDVALADVLARLTENFE